MSEPLSPAELTGRARTHVVDLAPLRGTLHRDAVEPFLAMRAAAAKAGIDLVAQSSFRDFGRQVQIWNAKFRGERRLEDARGRPLDATRLDPARRVAAILQWSALPGASRHHWGTDLDIVDLAAVPAGYEVQLVPAEYRRGGPFALLAGWLEGNARRYGFYRPYVTQQGGVRPEPWHYSYAPSARGLARRITVELLGAALEGAGLEGEAEVRSQLPRIVERYVLAVDAPPRMRSRWARGAA